MQICLALFIYQVAKTLEIFKDFYMVVTKKKFRETSSPANAR